MNRFEAIKYTHSHRKVVKRIANELGYSFPFHDLDKYLWYILFGKELGHKIHRRISRHHEHDGDIKNKIEAAIDWESARFTKPDKPLDAYNTWKKFYPHIDMEETLKLLNLWHE